MSIRVTCNNCGKELNAKDESAGKKVKCPGCGDVLAIPDGVMDAVSDDGYGDDSYGDNPYAENADSGDKNPCPMCGEMIKPGAAKCRFCGEIFDATLKKKAAASDTDANMTTGDWVVAILCSGIGCIAGIVWMIQGKPKWGKMLGISLLMAVIWNVISFALQGIAPQR